MKRLLQTFLIVGSSRAIAPVVIGLFFLFYIGIAFFTDETLIALMAFTRKSIILAAILSLIPLSCGVRILQETVVFMKRRRSLSGKSVDSLPELFDETVELPVSPFMSELEGRLIGVGYKTRRSLNTLAAWRGISLFPARMLFLTATCCLFTGILISVTSRTSDRRMVIEGESMPMPDGTGGTVERITLANSSGSILAKTLTMEIAPSNSGQGKKTFGLYPPALYGGSFVYPRYLGLAVLLRFSAPDLQAGYDTHCSLNTYPPGKEDNVVIPGSPYRIVLSVPIPAANSERYVSYMSGKINLLFKVLKGKEVLFSGSVPAGGEFMRDGYRLALPDVRRLVITDFIGDYGVLLIWAAGLIFATAVSLWLPIRLFFPRREMLLSFEPDLIRSCSRSEGRARTHAGVFHEVLDLVDARKV